MMVSVRGVPVAELVEASVTELVEASVTELVEVSVTELVEVSVTELVEVSVTELVEVSVTELVEVSVTELVEVGLCGLGARKVGVGGLPASFWQLINKKMNKIVTDIFRLNIDSMKDCIRCVIT